MNLSHERARVRNDPARKVEKNGGKGQRVGKKFKENEEGKKAEKEEETTKEWNEEQREFDGKDR